MDAADRRREREEGLESLTERAAGALRAGERRRAGWLLRRGFMTGEAPPDELLDALTPELGSYALEERREFPIKDLTSSPTWLPDGRLGALAVNEKAFYAWDRESGEHEVLHRRDQLKEIPAIAEGWWLDHSRPSGVLVAPNGEAIYLTYDEDLPTGGTAVARCHWIGHPLGGEPEYLGFHGSYGLVGSAGAELLGLDTWHSGSTCLQGWKIGEEIPASARLFAESIQVAPGTCLRRGALRATHPEQIPAHVAHYRQQELLKPPLPSPELLPTPSPELAAAPTPKLAPATPEPAAPPPPKPEPALPPGLPLVFYSACGGEALAELRIPGSLKDSYSAVSVAWGGRILVRSEDGQSLILYRRGEEIARRALPADLPLDDRWTCTPHPSGWLVALSFSRHEELVLLDLRDGSEQRLELPKYYSGYRVLWGPGGELALAKSREIIFARSD